MGEGKEREREREREGHVGEQRGMGRSRASAGMNIAREGRREGKVTEGAEEGEKEGRGAIFHSGFGKCLHRYPPPSLARSLPLRRFLLVQPLRWKDNVM